MSNGGIRVWFRMESIVGRNGGWLCREATGPSLFAPDRLGAIENDTNAIRACPGGPTAFARVLSC